MRIAGFSIFPLIEFAISQDSRWNIPMINNNDAQSSENLHLQKAEQLEAKPF
tara:strand:+ start:260 stop:415 length:156 start_codon:yes stop_codon:yes gene_type:complete